MQLKFNAIFAYASAAVLSSVVIAAPVSNTPNLIIFGNSLSDVGNAAALTNSPAYWNGRYSNSYVWDEYAAKLLGMNLVNKAYGGATSNNELSPATSGSISIPSLHDQVTTWLEQNPSPSQYNLDNDIIEIEIGGNDVLHRAAGLLAGTVDVTEFATQLAATIASDIKTLSDAGYKNINIWNLPAVEKTPIITGYGAGSLVKPLVALLNQSVKSAVDSVIASDPKASNVHIFDVNGLMEIALQPTVLSALGITDSTDACFTQDSSGKVSICSNPDEYFFYDGVHPASRMHYLWGIAAAVLTRDPNANIDTNAVLKYISTFAINQSNRDDNIIVDGLTPSESGFVPPASATYSTTDTVTDSATESDTGSTNYSTA
ncbi:hypothetical protein GGI05_002157, partial [Coemansia sp. RSA 2603]